MATLKTLGLSWMRPVGHDVGDKAIPAGYGSPTRKIKACGKDSDGRVMTMVIVVSCGSGGVVRPCTTVCVPSKSYCM